MPKPWVPTSVDFNAFIEWLDGGVASHGGAYVEMHARLVSYFARKGCAAPDTLADETLTRVARRLQEAGQIKDVSPAQYCYIVARFVLLEHLRSGEHRAVQLPVNLADASPVLDANARERLLMCLSECLARLSEDDRELILTYYSGEGAGRIATRRALAAKYGLTPNALMIRASRLRERLRACLAECRQRGRQD